MVARVPGGALAVLATLLLAPAAARASCGDHVLVTTSKAKRPAPADPSRLASAAPDDPLPSPHLPAAPCSGPMCSKAPPSAPATSTSLVQQRAHEAALPAHLPFPAEAQPSRSRLDHPLAAPVRRAAAIFHPPRV